MRNSPAPLSGGVERGWHEMSLAHGSSCRSGGVWDRDLSSRCDVVRLARPAQETVTDIRAPPPLRPNSRSKERVTLVLSMLGLPVWHWNSVP